MPRALAGLATTLIHPREVVVEWVVRKREAPRLAGRVETADYLPKCRMRGLNMQPLMW